MPRSLPVQLTESPETDLVNYRALPAQALIGLILGLLSPAAFVDPLLWIVPVLGIFFSVWALRRIKRNPAAVTGRKRALLGLALALFSLAAAPTDLFAYRQLVQNQARQVADTWFQCLQKNQPLTAGKMVVAVAPPRERPAMGGVASQKPVEVDRFSMTPIARALLAMGPARPGAVLSAYDAFQRGLYGYRRAAVRGEL